MNKGFVNLLVRWAILALGVALSAKIVNGISYDSGTTLLVVVLLLSLFNAVLKPLLMLFSLPFIVMTLGVGIWLINALLFFFVGRIVEGFRVETFGAALLGALIVSVTNLILNRLLMPPTPPRTPPPGAAPRGPSAAGKSDDVIDI
jgi:putative membrane protein